MTWVTRPYLGRDQAAARSCSRHHATVRDLARIRRQMGITAPDALIARGLFGWAALFGCIGFEVFGQYGPDTFAQPGDLFEHHLDALVDVVGLG